MARARLVHDTGNGASGGNAHVAFTQAAAVKRACAGCRLLRRFSIVHAAPHFPHWPNPGNSRRGGLVATGAWRCAAPQGLGSECSVFRVWMQRFTSVTRMLQRSVMCVSKALTPQEEHGGSPCGDRGNKNARKGRRGATTPRSFESSIASKQGRRGRKWRNGALLQGQLFKKRRVTHGKEGLVKSSV